jgi:hypothetical protein
VSFGSECVMQVPIEFQKKLSSLLGPLGWGMNPIH